MLEGDKATSPVRPWKRAEKAVFSGRTATNELLGRGINASGESSYPKGFWHSDQCLQGLLMIMLGVCGGVQIVNNF